MARQLVGRESEFGVLHGFLDQAATGSAAAILLGEPGIGKTAVWRAACETARDANLRVLRARPAGAEVRLSFAAMGDLIGDTLDDILPRLPAPQARALEVALLRADPAGESVDRHAVAAGFRSTLEALAVEGPVLVAIDDSQWLDEPSVRALEFALRRLAEARVGFLLAERSPGGSSLMSALAHALPVDRVHHVALGPFSLEDLHHVLRANDVQVPPRPTLARIARASGGNPLYALGIARTLVESGDRGAAGQALPIPETLTAALAGRIENLPRRTRSALLLAALSSAPRMEMLEQAMEGTAATALARAETARVIEFDGSSVRFTHPLLAIVAEAGATLVERRDAHRRLAEASTASEERARHLALAASQPDTATAEALELAARDARQRGAMDSAAELAALSVGLTPDDRAGDRGSRMVLLAEYLLLAGDTQQARSTLDGLLEIASDGSVRARALLLLARITNWAGNSVEGADLGERALAEAEDPVLRATAHVELGFLYRHDYRRGLEHAQHAVAMLERMPDGNFGLLALALLAVISAQTDLGCPLDLEAARRMLELATDRAEPRVGDRIGRVLGYVFVSYDEIARGRDLLTTMLQDAEDEGNEGSIPTILDQLGPLEVVAGNWPLARRYAERQYDLAVRTNQHIRRVAALETLASIDAREGRLDEAMASVTEALATARLIGDRMEQAFDLRTLGFIALSAGDPSRAMEALDEVDRIAEQAGVRSPGILRYEGDHIEAVLELGERDRADALLVRLEERAQASGVRSAAASAARCRALIFAAAGDLDAALSAADRAVHIGAALEIPFDLGRSYLVKGQLHRRRREKRLAKEALGEAEAIFESLGARPWIDRVLAETARLGLRPKAPGDLTPTETRVAELAAAGLTNPEIAARLFMSRKTVEFNLGKVYRKLGVRGRTELSRLF